MGATLDCASEEKDAQRRQRTVLEREIGPAIKSGQIVPYYQPLVDLRTGAVIGCEALARWKHPTYGLLLPWIFIPIAKGAGHISALTYALLRQAIQDSQAWPESLSISLNLSPLMVANSWLAADILQILKECNFPAQRLELEITETTLIGRAPEAKAVLKSLHNLGVRISLDDFGAGYSGLSYLRKFDIDGIKLDRSFVEILSDPHDQQLVGSIITFCHGLGLSVTAEGIESVPTLRRLTELGCDIGQGYLLSKPKPNSGFLRYLHRHPAHHPGGASAQIGRRVPSEFRDGRSNGSGIAGLKALDLLPAQIAVLDEEGTIISTNQAWNETADLRLSKGRWNYLEECAAADARGCVDGRVVGEGIAKILSRELNEFVATYSCPFDRRHHWFQISVRRPRVSDEGIGAIVMHVDVTALQHDHLTGLANRALFQSQAQYALDVARQNASAVGLALIDLDGFKPINDQFGHAAGDKVLVEVAQRLSSAATDDELVARLGGDEFGAVTWIGSSEVSLGRLARDLKLAFKQPFLVNSKQSYVSASIGTALYPTDGQTLALLLKIADSRMYGLKRAAKGRAEKWIA
jgi:diguanylate cyclase (GGDEF)-like protein